MKTFKTTIYTFLMLLAISFTAQSQDKGVTLDFDNYQANVELLQGYTAAMKAGDAKKLNSFFADDALIIGLGGTNDTISKQDHLERYTQTFKENTFSFSGDVYLSVETDENVAVTPGQYGFSWGVVTNTNKKTKKTATAQYHVVALLVDGKMAFLSHYYDTMPFALRDGATLIPSK
ncbi:nuclear transport factor 2 family protein [Rasiella sp. SM2506]|uniref:nuclear transport factor 2 family protein n=1 Tax=Rasiella sp. SM2506 TaxID=3423914 RepID=UPI003D7A4964